MIHHKRTREDRHKNTPNALAIYVRVRLLPVQATRGSSSSCVWRVPAPILPTSLYAEGKIPVRVTGSFPFVAMYLFFGPRIAVPVPDGLFFFVQT